MPSAPREAWTVVMRWHEGEEFTYHLIDSPAGCPPQRIVESLEYPEGRVHWLMRMPMVDPSPQQEVN